MFFKLQENNPKKVNTPYMQTIAELSHEDKIIQKNLKYLLNQCEILETLEYAIKNKNNALDIFGVIDQSIEKDKAIKKFSSNTNFDMSGSLIITSMRQRFMKNRNPHQEFSKFITAILNGYEKDIELDTQDRNISLSLLIKHKNRMTQRINQT